MLERFISVSKTEKSLISPATDTPNHTLYLSELDFTEQTYPSQVGVYEAESPQRKDPTKVLKDSLAKLLVYYYPVAGRLNQVSGDLGNVAVNCNGQGVLFVQAEAKCTLEDVCFLCEPFIHSEESSIFAVFDTCKPLGNTPLLSIQVTIFKCGGFTVGTKWPHILMDGVGFSQFMRAFAEITKNNGEWPHSTLPRPVWGRERLSPRKSPETIIEVKQHEEVVPAELYVEHLKARKPLGLYTFRFSQASIDRLKARVMKESGGEVKFCSTFEAVTALMWKTYAEIMEVHSDVTGYTLSGFKFPMSVRGPLRKVISDEGYYGNCVVNASLLHKDLKRQNGDEPLNLGDVVRGIRNEKGKVSSVDHVRSVIDYLCLEGLRRRKMVRKKLLSDEMAFYDWSKLTWFADFGVGIPKCFVFPLQYTYPSAMFFPKGTGHTLTYVQVALPQEIMPLFKGRIEKVMFITESLLHQEINASSRL